ncbi:hypothetical protein CEXT_454531 [Caerostris extrusa]|uniref:Uncharacterized protein n=1 Tax=Caerostris extrusa TaxID=172846 RepID=A0AAV4M2X7_CAEEX|nr:hypothetical protein CEXT_454531 [Caerostris extrusa]
MDNLGFEFERIVKFLFSALRYNTKVKFWVVMKYTRNIFLSSRVSISLGISKNIESVVQYCRKDIVAKYIINWTDATAKEKCGSYMAVVAYCKGKKKETICNHIEVNNLLCGTCS